MMKKILLIIISCFVAGAFLFNAFAPAAAQGGGAPKQTLSFDQSLLSLDHGLQVVVNEFMIIPEKKPSLLYKPVFKDLDNFAESMCEIAAILANPNVQEVFQGKRLEGFVQTLLQGSLRLCSAFRDLKHFAYDVETVVIPNASKVIKRFECLRKSEDELARDSYCKSLGCGDRKAALAESLRESYKFLQPFIRDLLGREIPNSDEIEEGALMQLAHLNVLMPDVFKRELKKKYPQALEFMDLVDSVMQDVMYPLIVNIIIPLFDMMPALAIAINPPSLQKVTEEVKEKLIKLPPVKLKKIDLDEITDLVF